MAQANRNKRRRKHRGTQAGNIERAGRSGSSGSRGGGARRGGASGGTTLTAAQRRAQRLDRKPTWRGSINRAVLAAIAFGVIIGVLRKNVAQAVAYAAFVLVVYIPMTYYIDTFMYRRRQRQKQATRP